VVAAGGIADGRGLAAALMLGAAGVLIGTRFHAAEESLLPAAAKLRIVQGSGDDTPRTKIFDIAAAGEWAQEYTGRVLANRFSETWQGREPHSLPTKASSPATPKPAPPTISIRGHSCRRGVRFDPLHRAGRRDCQAHRRRGRGGAGPPASLVLGRAHMISEPVPGLLVLAWLALLTGMPSEPARGHPCNIQRP
jgi:hypothetical protein